MTLEKELLKLFIEGTSIKFFGKTGLTIKNEEYVFTLMVNPRTFNSCVDELIYCIDVIDESLLSDYFYVIYELNR